MSPDTGVVLVPAQCHQLLKLRRRVASCDMPFSLLVPSPSSDPETEGRYRSCKTRNLSGKDQGLRNCVCVLCYSLVHGEAATESL